MAFELSGYVLEPVRVGQSNATFTQTPDILLSDQAAFDDAYPADESAPRVDYLVLVTSEGVVHPSPPESARYGLLESARFGYTKNEVVARFDYDAQAGAFKPLRGAAPVEVGVLSADANTTRLRVRPPVQSAFVADAPYRLSVGSGSGVQWAVQPVPKDVFGSPPPGTVELSMETGNLHWNAEDLSTFTGQRVRFQQQQFYEPKDSTGNLGTAPIATADPPLILNPLPGSGQFPRLRFGYGFYLTTVEVPDEEAFATTPPPDVGAVQWAADTGRLRFNATDATNHVGIPVYYDGVLFNSDMALPVQSLGSIASPGVISGLPPLGADLIFALPNSSPYYRFPNVTYRAAASFTSGKKGEVQVDPSTGQVKFSTADQTKFAGQDVMLYFGDLPIERGVSVRFLRNPVNLDAALPLKDVTAIYTVEGATWADPIIQSPQVSLPSLPIEDTNYPITVRVVQGQGSYVSDDFPNLNAPPPPPLPAGLGYYIDFDQGSLFFAQRKIDQLIPIQSTTSDVVLPDPLLLPSNLTFDLVRGTEVKHLTIGEDVLVDTTAGVVSLASTNTLVLGGTASVLGGVLTDVGAQFVTDGVQPGYLVVLANEAVYAVAAVLSETTVQLEPAVPDTPSVTYAIYENREILADRYFDPAELLDPSTSVERVRALGTATNDAPRLSVPVAYVESSGFRLGASQSDGFATVVLVVDDSAFGSPAAGTVELSQETGNLNFATGDLGKSIYWSRRLTSGKDYELQPELGLVQFRDRMLAGEEARITYTVAPPSTFPPTLPGPPVTEYATFLIRKELTQPHPTPTSTLSFNVAGLPVALNPSPAVFRGGRPQKLGIQCVVDPARSQITFLSDSQITDALPHGATVAPNERVYIDYYVTQAVGGEKSFTVLQPPILTSMVKINEVDGDGNLSNQFVVHGDHTGTFPAGHLLRIEHEEVYLLGGSTYDAEANETTVALYNSGTIAEPSQVFQSAFNDPQVYVSSGPTPITSAASVPAYFVAEIQPYEAIARGSNTFLIAGDQTLLYRTGVVVLFTDSGSTFTDFLQVSGAAYDAATNRTTVMLFANAIRQYVLGEQLLLRSVRPVFDAPVTEAQTSRIPKLTQPYLVFRRVAGEPGEVLVSPVDYTIQESGHIVFTEPLGPFEEWSIFYTGLTTVDPGTSELPLNLKASYTCQIAPSATNGLLGQTLIADYSISSPDTFYYRVETMTNFRGEYAAEIAKGASSGSSGPQTSNSSQPDLWEQGRKSLYFDEKHLANQDIIARSSLLFYNDLVNLLEDYRRTLDGTVVGNNDGKLLFDGSVGHLHPPGSPDNQIDDVIKVSNAPYSITYPPFAVTSIGTFRKYYLPGSLSRFYPTAKNFFGVSTVTATTVTGDEVLDTRSTNVTQVSGLHTRLAWAVLTESTRTTGAKTLRVDFAAGTEPGFDAQAEAYARPPFKNGMKCLVQRRNGTFINGIGNPITVTAVTENQLSITGLFSVAEAGATVYRSPADSSTQVAPDTLTNYVLGRDYSFHGEPGQVTYVKQADPPMQNTPLVASQALSGQLTLTNTLTAPLRFPALFGGIEDDDGDLSFPIQSPDPKNEQAGFLATEAELIAQDTGLLRTLTTAPIVSIGSNMISKGRIDDPTLSSMLPAPQPRDLIRILSGANGSEGLLFRRITGVNPGYLLVDHDFSVNDTDFSYEIVVSPDVAAGRTSSGTTTSITDTTASFLSAVKIGYTIHFYSTSQLRRQISAVTDTSITFFPAVPSFVGADVPYRIEKSLATYRDLSAAAADHATRWATTLNGEAALYAQQESLLLEAINLAFTEIVSGASGEVSAGQPLFTDSSASFSDDKVLASYYVFIDSGLNAGFHYIQDVDSQTQLTVAAPFSASEVGISYRIVKLFGLSEDSVKALFALYQSTGDLVVPISELLTKLAPAPVDPFSGPESASSLGTPYVNSLLGSDLDTREQQVTARLAELPTTLTQITDILTSTDQLYDKRYVWIDTRINLESGLLVQQDTAVKNRIKAQAEVIKQLTKLLAVGGA